MQAHDPAHDSRKKAADQDARALNSPRDGAEQLPPALALKFLGDHGGHRAPSPGAGPQRQIGLSAASHVGNLQRSAGNRAVRSLLTGGAQGPARTSPAGPVDAAAAGALGTQTADAPTTAAHEPDGRVAGVSGGASTSEGRNGSSRDAEDLGGTHRKRSVQRWPSLRSIGSKIVGTATNLASKAGSAVSGAVGAVGGLASGAIDAIRDRITALGAALRSGWTALQDRAAGAAASVGGAIRQGVVRVGQMGSAVAGGVRQAVSTAGLTMGSLTSGFNRLVHHGFGRIRSSTAALGRSLKNMDAGGLRRSWAAIRGSVSGMSNRLWSASRALTERARALWTSVTSRYQGAIAGIGRFASGLGTQLQGLAASAWQGLSSMWEGLRARAASMGGIGGALARAAQAVLDRVLAAARALWAGISRGWASVRQRLGALAGQVRDQLARARAAVTARARASFAGLRRAWERNRQRVATMARQALTRVTGSASRLKGFSIEAVARQVGALSKFLKWVRWAQTGASATLDRRAGEMAATIGGRMPALANQKVAENFGSAQSGGGAASGPALQRREDPSARSSMATADAFSQVGTAIAQKWSKLSLKQLVKDVLYTFIWPWPAVGQEFVALWGDWKSSASRLFKPRGSSLWTWLQDLYTNLLALGDLPRAILRRLINICGALMGWVTIILTAGGAVVFGAVGSILGPGGTAAGAIAGAGAGLAVSGEIGVALLIAFAASETIELVKRLTELVTANLTTDQKAENVNNASDSAIGLGVAAAAAALVWVASKIAGTVVKAVRKFRAEPKELPPKPVDTPENKPPKPLVEEPGAPVRAGETPKQFGERLGAESKGQPSRFDYVVEQVNKANLSQRQSADAVAAATKGMGLNLVEVVDGPNIVLSSVMPGTSRPVVIVKPNGTAVRGVADISIANPPSLERPIRLDNVVEGDGPGPAPKPPKLDPPELKNAAEQASFERFKKLPEFADGEYGKSPVQEVDWVDSRGKTYDQMGNPETAKFWTKKNAANFMRQIDKHVAKADYLVLDLTGFTEGQKAQVRTHIDTLSAAQQAKIVRIGF